MRITALLAACLIWGIGCSGRDAKQFGGDGAVGGSGGSSRGTGGSTAGMGGSATMEDAGVGGDRSDGGAGGSPNIGGAGGGATGGAGTGTGGKTAAGGAADSAGQGVGGAAGGGGKGTGGAAGGTSGTKDGGTDAATDAKAPVDAIVTTDAPVERVCATEKCNGKDDDCDGVIDNGCPMAGEALGTKTAASTSALFGSVAGVPSTKFTDGCPNGQVIIGFTGNSGVGLDAIGVRCGTVLVHEDRSVTPFDYSVTVEPGTEFEPVGGDGGKQNMIESVLLCGSNEVVVAVHVTSEPVGGTCPADRCGTTSTSALGCPTIYGLKVSCGRYDITGTPGAFQLALMGSLVPSTRAGGAGRADVPATVTAFSCGPRGAVREINGSFGPWPYVCSVTAVNALQFVCNTPTIPLR